MINQTSLNDTPIKGKRGRKSKKELMSALNLKSSDIVNDPFEEEILEILETETAVDPATENVIFNISEISDNDTIVIISNPNLNEEVNKPIVKRGRKPKGGKIIPQAVQIESFINDKPNVILHLKCSMKDLHIQNISNIDSYTFTSKNELNYEIIGGKNITSTNSYDQDITIKNNDTNDDVDIYDDDDDDDDDDQPITNLNNNKKIWKKLKHLEYNLHTNNINKKSACFWDSCDFDNPPIYIPKNYINGTYQVYGCFCSPECGVAHLMNENIDSSTKFERYHLFNHIYSKIYDYKKNIKPAPDPHYMLEKFYGNLSIQEYRSLLRNERLFIIVDKPLIRILPELHDDNDEFILNNKLIPTNNNFQVKQRMQKGKKNKSSILNENFGISIET